MTLKQITFDGQADGTAITTQAQLPGSSGFSIAGSSSMAFKTADGMRGTSGLRINVGTGTAIVRYDLNADNDVAAFDIVFTMPAANPTVFAPFFNVRSGAGRVASLGISTNGRLYFADGAAAGGTISYITPTVGTLTLGAQYRVSLRLHGNSTTAATVQASVYTPTGTTPLVTPLSLTNANLTAATLHQVELGNSGPSAISIGIDDLQMDDGRTTEIGPILVALATPTVTLGATVNPTTGSSTDGSQTVSWSAVPNAGSYDVWLATKATPSQADFVLAAAGVTSPYTFTGLAQGTYSFGVQAKP